MHVRRLVNVLLYALSAVALLAFLGSLFRRNTTLALIAVLLFVVRLIRTEVVANAKSRDEILSLLFISLMFVAAFRYRL